MDLSKFVTYNKQESLLLSIAKSLDIVENTLSKPQEILEVKMSNQKESVSFDTPLELPGNWMMGETSLEVYNTVYNITKTSNKLKMFYPEQMLIKYKASIEFVSKIKTLYETSGDLEKVKKVIVDNYNERYTFPKTDYDYLMKIIDQTNQNNNDKTNFIVLDYIASVTDSIEIELPPGAISCYK